MANMLWLKLTSMIDFLLFCPKCKLFNFKRNAMTVLLHIYVLFL